MTWQGQVSSTITRCGLAWSVETS